LSRTAAPARPAAREDSARRRALIAWYRRAARDLPWRKSRDPYRIWVSEIMLQQTQVATATPYYERFIARFPDARALAASPLDDVLALWAGLGYYRRARHLHAAAGVVVREHGGRVPDDPEVFAALPGVGRYTLGAVLSIGHGRALPLVDGNVARVFARWWARPWQVKRPADAKALWALAAEQLPARGAGEWNQALMELGATVCTPRAPRCGECPVSRHCRAFALGRVEAFPPAARRRATERVRRAVAWLERDGRVLVVRRRGALLDGLWEPPGVELAPGEDATRALAVLLRSLGIRATLADTGARVRHAITHRSIEVELWRGRPTGRMGEDPTRRWAEPRSRELALTALTRKLAVKARD
jgi:A/G-specific adenine glycosylase